MPFKKTVAYKPFMTHQTALSLSTAAAPKNALTLPKFSRKAFRPDLGMKKAIKWIGRHWWDQPSLIVPPHLKPLNFQETHWSNLNAILQCKNIGGAIYLSGLLPEKKFLRALGSEMRPIVFTLTTREECSISYSFPHPDKHSPQISQIFCPLEDHGFQDPSTGLLISLSKLSEYLSQFQQLRMQDKNRPALFHCWGGAGRSAAVLIMWMIQYLGILPNDAAILVHQNRKNAKLFHHPLNQKKSVMNPHGLGMVGSFYYQVLAKDLTDRNLPLRNLIEALCQSDRDGREKGIVLNLDLIFKGDFSNMEEEDQNRTIENFQRVRQHLIDRLKIDILTVLSQKIISEKNLISLINFSIITARVGESDLSTKTKQIVLGQLKSVSHPTPFDPKIKCQLKEIKEYLSHELVVDMLLTSIDQHVEDVLTLIPCIQNPSYLVKLYSTTVHLNKKRSIILQQAALQQIVALAKSQYLTPEQFVHFAIQTKKNHPAVWNALMLHPYYLLQHYLNTVPNPNLSVLISSRIEKMMELHSAIPPKSMTKPSFASEPSTKEMFTSVLRLQGESPFIKKIGPFSSTFPIRIPSNPSAPIKDLHDVVEEIKKIKSQNGKAVFPHCTYEQRSQTISIKPNPHIGIRKVWASSNKTCLFKTEKYPYTPLVYKGKAPLAVQYHQKKNEFVIDSSNPMTPSDIRKFALVFLVMATRLGWTNRILDVSNVPANLKPLVKKHLQESGIRIIDIHRPTAHPQKQRVSKPASG